jgi:hypothetical protein
LKKPSGIYAARAFSSRCRPIAGSPKRRFAKDALLDGRHLYRIAHPGFATSSPPRGAPAVSQACPALVRRCGFLPTGVPDNVALLTHGEASVPSAVARSNLGLFSGCPNKTLHCLAHSSLRLASLNDSHDPIIQRPDMRKSAAKENGVAVWTRACDRGRHQVTRRRRRYFDPASGNLAFAVRPLGRPVWPSRPRWPWQHCAPPLLAAYRTQQLRLRSVTTLLPKTDSRPVGDRKRRGGHQAWPQSSSFDPWWPGFVFRTFRPP